MRREPVIEDISGMVCRVVPVRFSAGVDKKLKIIFYTGAMNEKDVRKELLYGRYH